MLFLSYTGVSVNGKFWQTSSTDYTYRLDGVTESFQLSDECDDDDDDDSDDM